MTKRMLIDATHFEEKRVAIINEEKLEEFDFETSTKQQVKGNIYLAKVIRVEPSLQAAFVEYGVNRHGFLAFSEIHPDYYKIPMADQIEGELRPADPSAEADETDASQEDPNFEVEEIGGQEEELSVPHRTTKPQKGYKIQDVIKRRQIMLVQVVKEERHSKGAALTTFLSLAGRYCVLMPNAEREGGVSRKITNSNDRKRLKTVIEGLEIPDNMGIIIRTAGMERSKIEIRRDFDYLIRLWNEIREKTMQSTAPALIYQEGDLIKRSIRDLYSRDIEEIIIEGEEGYKAAKHFMKTLMPSHTKKISLFENETLPIFHKYKVESMIDAIHGPTVQLRSGGYIVINPTEALVAIDVNSGRATRERHIEETAYKTNLEAAEEIALQLRLRDLAGLIVIDFIDMEEQKNVSTVERKLKEAMSSDRARIQIGRISPFGLLELSRQRLRPSIIEVSTQTCQHCQGTGHVRSTESSALHVLRTIEDEAQHAQGLTYTVKVPEAIAFYLLNHKRQAISVLETKYNLKILVLADQSLIAPQLVLDYLGRQEQLKKKKKEQVSQTNDPKKRGQRHFERHQPKAKVVVQSSVDEKQEAAVDDQASADQKLPSPSSHSASAAEGEAESIRRRRRRRRRKGMRSDGTQNFEQVAAPALEGTIEPEVVQPPLAPVSQKVPDENKRQRVHKVKSKPEKMTAKPDAEISAIETQPKPELELKKQVVKEKGRVLKDAPQAGEKMTKEPASKKTKNSPVKKKSSEIKSENVEKAASDGAPDAAHVSSEKTRSSQKRRGWWKRLLDNQP
jgi:ribonuclease E